MKTIAGPCRLLVPLLLVITCTTMMMMICILPVSVLCMMLFLLPSKWRCMRLLLVYIDDARTDNQLLLILPLVPLLIKLIDLQSHVRFCLLSRLNSNIQCTWIRCAEDFLLPLAVVQWLSRHSTPRHHPLLLSNAHWSYLGLRASAVLMNSYWIHFSSRWGSTRRRRFCRVFKTLV